MTDQEIFKQEQTEWEYFVYFMEAQFDKNVMDFLTPDEIAHYWNFYLGELDILWWEKGFALFLFCVLRQMIGLYGKILSALFYTCNFWLPCEITNIRDLIGDT